MNSLLRRSLALAALALLFSAPGAAASFTVHGYELGERIQLTNNRQVYTALFDVSLDADRGISFCVDLDTYIGVGTYEVRDVGNAQVFVGPSSEAPRDFGWAGLVMDKYGVDVDGLTTPFVTRTQAITGIQAAIWEGIYGGGVVVASSLSGGARNVYDRIVSEVQGTPVQGPSSSVIVELAGNQDQVFSNPVPEPGAALVFSIGALILRGATRRRKA